MESRLFAEVSAERGRGVRMYRWASRFGALLVLLPLVGCEAVGPDYIQPAAIVPEQYKEMNGWKISWNGQPGGGLMGLGGSPPTGVRARPLIVRSGTASSSMRV